MTRGARAAELSWIEVEARLASGSVAILPIGAAAKEHGPHLPLATDWLTAEALGRALAEREDVLVFPSIGYGFYPAFVAYPGSTSVPEGAFEETCRALVAARALGDALCARRVPRRCRTSAGGAHAHRGRAALAGRERVPLLPRRAVLPARELGRRATQRARAWNERGDSSKSTCAWRSAKSIARTA